MLLHYYTCTGNKRGVPLEKKNPPLFSERWIRENIFLKLVHKKIKFAFSFRWPWTINFYRTSQISEFHAISNANAQLTKNRSHLFYHTSQTGGFETILNANAPLNNTLNSFYHTLQISELKVTLNAIAQLTKNRSHLFDHTSQIGEFETILNANIQH